MSERISERVVGILQSEMYPRLPTDVQSMFPITTDPYLGTGPNIGVGPIQERGTGISFPAVAVWSEFNPEPLTDSKYIHVSLYIDIWSSQVDAGNRDGRRFVGILSNYVGQSLEEVNWSGHRISVKRCYEIRRSGVMFEPAQKQYHQLLTYRVEAGSDSGWY